MYTYIYITEFVGWFGETDGLIVASGESDASLYRDFGDAGMSSELSLIVIF